MRKKVECYLKKPDECKCYTDVVDGLVEALTQKNATLVYRFEVHRRETVQSYKMQLLKGLQAHKERITKICGGSVAKAEQCIGAVQAFCEKASEVETSKTMSVWQVEVPTSCFNM